MVETISTLEISVIFVIRAACEVKQKKGACERDLTLVANRDGRSPTLRQSEPRAASLCIALHYETLPLADVGHRSVAKGPRVCVGTC